MKQITFAVFLLMVLLTAVSEEDFKVQMMIAQPFQF
jgi:hypothetical protein